MEDYNNNYQNNNPNLYIPQIPQQKSNKKIWLLILIPIFIIIIGLVIFLFMNSSSKTISNNEFSQGTNIQLKENAEAKFILDDESHTIKVKSIGSNSVNLIIRSNPIQVNLKIGEEKKFDLDNDGFYDIQVKLNDIKEGIPEIFIKKIHESTCTENWNCGDWSSCVDGEQTRTCTDSNSCGTTEGKLDEQQSCTLQTIDCGSNIQSQETIGNQPNFDCFIDASENCGPSKLLNTITLELFGMVSTSTTHMELKGMESGKCVYYQRTEGGSIEFTDELVQQMLDSGSTQEEIDQQEQTANDSAQQTVGLEQTCKFNQGDLTAMLNRWKEGNFDIGGASCTLNPDGTSDCTYTGDFENAGCISSS